MYGTKYNMYDNINSFISVIIKILSQINYIHDVRIQILFEISYD